MHVPHPPQSATAGVSQQSVPSGASGPIGRLHHRDVARYVRVTMSPGISAHFGRHAARMAPSTLLGRLGPATSSCRGTKPRVRASTTAIGEGGRLRHADEDAQAAERQPDEDAQAAERPPGWNGPPAAPPSAGRATWPQLRRLLRMNRHSYRFGRHSLLDRRRFGHNGGLPALAADCRARLRVADPASHSRHAMPRHTAMRLLCHRSKTFIRASLIRCAVEQGEHRVAPSVSDFIGHHTSGTFVKNELIDRLNADCPGWLEAGGRRLEAGGRRREAGAIDD